MSAPAIITVAITGAVPTKRDSPAVPVTPAEQIESAHAAYESGAAVCHIHVRDAQERPSSDPGLYSEVQRGLAKYCPGMIVQFSTGGRGRTLEERKQCLGLRPDMASLSTGSCNFPEGIYENPPDFVEELAKVMSELGIKPEVEVFDMAMLYAAVGLVERSLLKIPIHLQIILGITNALPARETLLDFFVSEVQQLLPGATWTCAGIGRFQLEANKWSLARGGHVRTGLEDNLYFEKGRLAKSNAELVMRVAELCAEYDRPPATLAQAQQILGVSP